MRCLYCCQEIENTLNLVQFFFPHILCSSCKSKLISIKKHVLIRNIKTFVFFEYNDFFEMLIKQYKESSDTALARIFKKELIKLKKKYPNHKIVIPASSANKYFHPLKYLLQDFEIIECFKKKKKYKQALKNKKQRHQIQNNISLEFIPNEIEVLFFDDVVTSGYTLLTCVNLLEQAGIKVIPIVLSLHKNHSE